MTGTHHSLLLRTEMCFYYSSWTNTNQNVQFQNVHRRQNRTFWGVNVKSVVKTGRNETRPRQCHQLRMN